MKLGCDESLRDLVGLEDGASIGKGTVAMMTFPVLEEFSREEIDLTIFFVLFDTQEAVCRKCDDMVEHLGGGGTTATCREVTEL